tara:strand:- start:2942 stop:3049 length:108 start_codon:yes stop_codon:yes gene_type:complete
MLATMIIGLLAGVTRAGELTDDPIAANVITYLDGA